MPYLSGGIARTSAGDLQILHAMFPETHLPRSWLLTAALLCAILPAFSQSDSTHIQWLTQQYQQAVAMQKSGDLDAAIRTSKAALDSALVWALPPLAETGDLAHKLGVYYYIRGDYGQAESAYLEAIATRLQLGSEARGPLSRSYHNLGVALKEKGNVLEAIDQLEKALSLRQMLGEPVLQADSYLESAIILLEVGEYTRAAQYADLAEGLYRKNQEGPSFQQARSLQISGLAHYELDRFEEAVRILSASKTTMAELYGEKDPDVADLYNNLGNAYEGQGRYEEAISAYRNSMQINTELHGKESLDVAQNLNNLGLVWMKTGAIDRALSTQQKALAIKKRVLGDRHPGLAPTYDNLGDIYLDQNKLDQAWKHYNTGLYQLMTDMTDASRPASKLRVENLRGRGSLALVLLGSRAETELRLFDRELRGKYLDQAVASWFQADSLIDFLRRQLETRASKLFLLDRALEVYETGMEIATRIDYPDQSAGLALRCLEKSRAVLLLAGLREDRAKSNAGIPDSLLRQERALKADLAYVQSLAGEDSSLHTRERLVRLAQANSDFQELLESRFPRYYREKYDAGTLPMEDLQADLRMLHAHWVGFYPGQKKMFALLVSPEGARLLQWPWTMRAGEQLDAWLDALRTPQDRGALLELSEDLYRYVWSPISKYLPPEGRLILCPSGQLSFLPFGALPYEPASNIKDSRFLLERYAISYCYSATVLHNNLEPPVRRPSIPFLGVAPGFGDDPHLAALPNSGEEVAQVQNILGGKIMIGAEATLDHFLAYAHQPAVMHLSTHASAREGGWIAFSGGEDARLRMDEMSDLQLAARLAVLSACESGTGKLAPGEGVLSIARGFTQAGCQSTITSLWQVNHASTNDLFSRFYASIEEGLPVDSALQQAQLAYLRDSRTDEAGAHPYFWAAFVPAGDMRPVEISTAGGYWPWLLGGLGILVMGGVLNRIRRRG